MVHRLLELLPDVPTHHRRKAALRLIARHAPEWDEATAASLSDALLTTPGVGDVRVFGSSELSFRIWLDPNRMAAMKAPVLAVAPSLSLAAVMAAKARLALPDLTVTTLNQHWLDAIKEHRQ